MLCVLLSALFSFIKDVLMMQRKKMTCSCDACYHITDA